MRKLESRMTKSPGTRTKITLDIAETGLEDLMKGIHPETVWIVDNEDGSYSLRATQTMGESRKQTGKPADDLLIELLNEFGEELDKDGVPQHLRDKWVELIERFEAETVPND